MADKRLQTIEALLLGITAGWPSHVKLKHELRAIETSARISGPRRGLVRVLHTTRLLDSSLKGFLVSKGLQMPKQQSIGGFLGVLTNHNGGFSRLHGGRRQHYQKSVVAPRNLYMHSADEYPSNQRAAEILGEMHACLAEVFRL